MTSGASLAFPARLSATRERHEPSRPDRRRDGCCRSHHPGHTTSGVGNGSQTTLATLWAPLWPTTFRKGTVMDVQAGSKLETAIGAGNLRAYAATDLTGRDWISN
jgi:hypothetical protein